MWGPNDAVTLAQAAGGGGGGGRSGGDVRPQQGSGRSPGSQVYIATKY